MELSLRGLYYMIGMLMVATLTYYLGTHKIEYYKSQQFVNNHPTVDVIEKRLNCLAMNIYKEAGHEPFEGKVAVAQVTLNRVDHPAFPDSVCDVVYQKTKFTEKVVCQFSWYCDAIHRARPINRASYSESYEVAKKVLLEGFRLDSIKDALYYHADYVSPNWRYKKVAKIGTHIFYKDPRDDI